MSEKSQKKINILEDPRQLSRRISGLESYLNRHRVRAVRIAVVLVGLVLAYFGYRYYQSTQNEEAQRELFQAVYYFEADSLERALEGDGVNYGFLQVSSQYSGTQAANLAHFYAGVCYLKLGKYEKAVLELDEFSSSDWLLQARAYALLGDAYMEQEKYEQAAEYYEEAATYKSNKQFSPYYLKKAALAYERMQQPEAALDCYLRITEKHAGSALHEEAKKHIFRLGGKPTSP